MIPVDWNALVRHIDRSLPGRGLWMQCEPVFDDDRPTEEGVGLAIQREPAGTPAGNPGRWYTVAFFSVVPAPEAVGDDGRFLPGRGEEVSDWTVQVGYQGDHDNLGEAIDEAKDLARDLPTSGIYRTNERLEAILDQVTDPEDLEEIA
jgi:hypothetical protein